MGFRGKDADVVMNDIEKLHARYGAGELVVFHAIASPYRDRSHFDGQNLLENGSAKPYGLADGCLNRALSGLPGAARAVRCQAA